MTPSSGKRRSRLDLYRDRRDFRRSGEPRGKKGRSRKGSPPIFVIQEHDASTHHFDLRLEANGVLKSWAVPRGPSTDPREKRLAVSTEDHPVEYAEFEGRIPEEEYGGGAVIVWDAGPYRNLRKDADGNEVPVEDCIKDGKVEVAFRGKKITGGYALVRAGKTRRGRDRWLLVKMRDDDADARRNPVSTEPESVLSGRTIKDL
jgi:DNA ligase D-like protein (predicted 3'-phosphoesterase)